MDSSDKSINRELPLFPSTPHTSSFPAILVEERSIPQQQRQQQFTIFYDGRICVSDVTELRARAIIMAASREMEERKRTPPAAAAADAMQSQLCGASGVSMKRSLHQFLEKRNNRMAAMAPYRPHRYNNC